MKIGCKICKHSMRNNGAGELCPMVGTCDIYGSYSGLEPIEKKSSVKPTNPKDAIGVRKWRQFCTVPITVIWHIGVAMLEGACKYGRHNYRDSGVRASIYIDAAIGHITQWWEGEDVDKDSGLCHLDKALASLVVLRDGMLHGNYTDDRPPKAKLDAIRDNLQGVVEGILDKYPDPKPAFTEIEHGKDTADSDSRD